MQTLLLLAWLESNKFVKGRFVDLILLVTPTTQRWNFKIPLLPQNYTMRISNRQISPVGTAPQKHHPCRRWSELVWTWLICRTGSAAPWPWQPGPGWFPGGAAAPAPWHSNGWDGHPCCPQPAKMLGIKPESTEIKVISWHNCTVLNTEWLAWQRCIWNSNVHGNSSGFSSPWQHTLLKEKTCFKSKRFISCLHLQALKNSNTVWNTDTMKPMR